MKYKTNYKKEKSVIMKGGIFSVSSDLSIRIPLYNSYDNLIYVEFPKNLGMKWKQRRKMLTPSVHFSVVSSYLPIFKRSAEILVQRIYKHLETESVIDIHPFVPTFTLDIAGATSFGYDFGSQDFLKAVENFTKTLWIRNFSVWQRSYTLFKLFSSKYAAFKKDLDIIIGLSYRVIDNKREYYEKHGKVQGIDSNENSYKKKVALIDALLQLPGLSDRDIQ